MLAALTRDRVRALTPSVAPGEPHVVIGSNTLATAITLYALLELRTPALLIHPRLTDAERAAQVRAIDRRERPLPADAAAILHTSGTTGTPRAAVLTRAALIASAAASAANLGWQDDDRWLLCMPVARIGGLSILTRCLAARRCVVLAAGFDAATFPDGVATDGITLASLVPTMLHRVLDAHPGWVPPPQLRAVLVGGAAAPPALLRRAQERGLPIVLTYGMTETCSQVVATPYAARHAPGDCGTGRALPGADLRIRDGQIEVRGPMLMAGYLAKPRCPPAPGSTPAISGRSTQRVACTSMPGAPTSSSPEGRTSIPPRWNARWRSARASPPPASSASRTRSGGKRSPPRWSPARRRPTTRSWPRTSRHGWRRTSVRAGSATSPACR